MSSFFFAKSALISGLPGLVFRREVCSVDFQNTITYTLFVLGRIHLGEELMKVMHCPAYTIPQRDRWSLTKVLYLIVR